MTSLESSSAFFSKPLLPAIPAKMCGGGSVGQTTSSAKEEFEGCVGYAIRRVIQRGGSMRKTQKTDAKGGRGLFADYADFADLKAKRRFEVGWSQV
jgi:hypothetical protein